jgi:DNA-binding CsgD family transcriptional regulator
MSAYQLTPREREALELLAEGMVPKKIAEQMNISPYTYKDTIERARIRLDAKTTAQAVYIACKRGIL